jgi:hypothetical protein
MKTRQNDPVAMARLNELSRIDRKYNVAIWRSGRVEFIPEPGTSARILVHHFDDDRPPLSVRLNGVAVFMLGYLLSENRRLH